MKTTQTISQFFPIMRDQLLDMQLEVESNPADWHKSLQKAIDQGSFLRLDCSLLAGFKPVLKLLLVSPRGEAYEVTRLGGDHA
jgi:hypothetical protein